MGLEEVVSLLPLHVAREPGQEQIVDSFHTEPGPMLLRDLSEEAAL